MKSIIFVTTLSVMLAACSGGGGGSGNGGGNEGGTTQPTVVQAKPTTEQTQPAAEQAQPTSAQQLGSYIGTWVADCSEHELEYTTITRVSDDTVKLSSKSDYYAGANCTGTIIATQTDTGDVPATYAGSADASVVLPAATGPSTIKVDRFNATVPSYSLAVVGSGVTRVTKEGKPQWCMTFDDGSTLCIHDEGVHAGGASSGAFAIQGNQLYMLGANGSGFEVDQRLTRK